MESYPSHTLILSQHETDAVCIALERNAREIEHRGPSDARMAEWLRELRNDIRAGHCSPRDRMRDFSR